MTKTRIGSTRPNKRSTVVLLHESRCMRHSPGRLQHCAEFRNLTLCAAVTTYFQEAAHESTSSVPYFGRTIICSRFLCHSVGFAQAKSAGQKTTLTGCLQKGQNTWATK